MLSDLLKTIAAIIAWLIFGSAAGYVALVAFAGAKKPIAKTLQAEGGNRQQDRRRASNANNQEEPRTVPLGTAL